MKFGSQLELYAVPEWQDKYIHYNFLKRCISRRLAELKTGSSSIRSIITGASRPNDPSSLTSTQPSLNTPFLNQDIAETVNSEFLALLEKELTQVSNHFKDEFGFLVDKLDGVHEELTALAEEEVEELSSIPPDNTGGSVQLDTQEQPSVWEEFESPRLDLNNEDLVASTPLSQDSTSGSHCDVERQKAFKAGAKMRASHRQRLSRTVLSIWDMTDKLEGFVNLNIVALYKILKKRDKLLGIKRMSTDLTEKKRSLSLLIIPQTFKGSLRRLYKEACESDMNDSVEDIENLALLVQKQFVTSQISSVASGWISFFLGACTVAFIDLVLAALLPAANFAYSPLILLCMLPIFRLTLIVPLIFWGTAAALATFELYGVNYKFLLNIDPKCQVSSTTIFYIAQLLTAFWILGFGGFLIDAKFGILLDPFWYWLYPIIVILFHMCVFLAPSRTFRYVYRRNIFSTICTAFKSGLIPGTKVTLLDNIIGDILTSLPKPLLDLKYTVMFFGGFYFLDGNFSFTGFPEYIEKILLPFITAIPYWMRFIQCCTRFQLEPDRRRLHAGNIGKYCSTIVVIISSSIPWEQLGMSIYASRFIFVFTYIFASLYNLIWDIVFDWGLLPDPDHFVRPDHRVLYPQWMYYFITLFNVIARLTWALTLIPIAVLDDYRFNVAIIIFIISSIEVLRRSAWVVLRLENEHLTNSSRYRAMLWVPKMTDATSEQHIFIATSSSTQKQHPIRKLTTIAHSALVKREGTNLINELPTIPEERHY